MLYDNYIKRLSIRYSAEMSSIKAGYNFDFGDEYEIAVCWILRLFLPNNYGVCRGHIVNSQGDKVGDDIIVFDKSTFPTLGLRDEFDLSRKEFIPIEAVYCYIEAKHTLSSETLAKALEQLSDAKNFCAGRPKVSLGDLGNIEIDPKLLTVDQTFPDHKNPPWGAIIANNSSLTDAEILQTFADTRSKIEAFPDLILCNTDRVLVPVIKNSSPNTDTLSSFSLKGKTTLMIKEKEGLAPGVAMALLMSALKWLRLGDVNWKSVVADALDN